MIKVFEIDDKVNVAVFILDCASINDKCIFSRISWVVGNTYEIQTKYGILNHLHLSLELMPLPNIIDLKILDPTPINKINLYYISAQKSTTAIIFVHCRYKNQMIWYSTCPYACIKAGVKCSVTYHEEKSVNWST